MGRIGQAVEAVRGFFGVGEEPLPASELLRILQQQESAERRAAADDVLRIARKEHAGQATREDAKALSAALEILDWRRREYDVLVRVLREADALEPKAARLEADRAAIAKAQRDVAAHVEETTKVILARHAEEVKLRNAEAHAKSAAMESERATWALGELRWRYRNLFGMGYDVDLDLVTLQHRDRLSYHFDPAAPIVMTDLATFEAAEKRRSAIMAEVHRQERAAHESATERYWAGVKREHRVDALPPVFDVGTKVGRDLAERQDRWKDAAPKLVLSTWATISKHAKRAKIGEFSDFDTRRDLPCILNFDPLEISKAPTTAKA